LKIEKIIQTININPKTLFIIDGTGAILSAFLLGVVLVRFSSFFGIPVPVFYLLAIFPVLFFLFDIYAYGSIQRHAATKLKIIALANFLYCLLSISVAAYHAEQLTIWAWAYIFIEIFIVIILAAIELAVAKKN
jgi:hypothetical protein